jgi:nucleoside-diphosphate-sugar epimerase
LAAALPEMPLVALTGATGFVGRDVLAALREAGWRVRALTRRPTMADDLLGTGVEPVRGSLDDAASLEALVADADAVIHVAGAIQAADRAAFLAANGEGTGRVATAAAAAARPGARFLYLSSLAARAPAVSAYAESKALGEREAHRRQDTLRVAIVRPPAVYGPGDRATLPIMRSLARGWLVAPRAAVGSRFSLLYVRDLSALVVKLLDADLPTGAVLEPSDGKSGGYGWPELAALAGRELGRKVRVVEVPRGPFDLVARLAELQARLTGRSVVLSRLKVAELFHPDWVGDPATMAALRGWGPEVDFARGLPLTLAWYREAGWL